MHNKKKSENLGAEAIRKVSGMTQPVADVTPDFLAAAAAGNDAQLMSFVERGGNIHAEDGDGRTAVHLAAMGGHEKIVGLLVEMGCHLDVQDKDGNTAIMLAADGGHGRVVNKLVLANADVFAKNAQGKMVLHYAAAKCSSGVVTGLLLKQSRGASEPDLEGNTPLSMAKARPSFPEKDYLLYLLDNWYFQPDQSQPFWCRKQCLCVLWNIAPRG